MFVKGYSCCCVRHFILTNSASCCIFYLQVTSSTTLRFLSACLLHVWCGSVRLCATFWCHIGFHSHVTHGPAKYVGAVLAQTLNKSSENVWKWCSHSRLYLNHFIIYIFFKSNQYQMSSLWVSIPQYRSGRPWSEPFPSDHTASIMIKMLFIF